MMRVDLTPDTDLTDEIERADGYKEAVYRAMINIEKAMKTQRVVQLL